MKLSRDKIQRMIDVGSGGSSGGVSSSELAGLLAGYATETWVDEHYISIDFFSRLFQAHGTENGSEIDVMPNDMETTITSVESMFGFWTNLYISALGSNGAAPAGISLGMLTDVVISGTPSAGQVLTFDAVSGKWVNANAQAGATTLANLTDVTLTSLQNGQTLLYDSTTSKWYNSALKTINGQSLLGSGDISVGGGASGNYLPLSGGTLTGNLFMSNASYIQLDTYASSARSNYISAGGGYGTGSGKYGIKVASTDQADALTGLGSDLSPIGGGYEFSIAGAGNPSNGYGRITFVSHIYQSTSYSYLGGFSVDANGISFDVAGRILENGTPLSGKYLPLTGGTLTGKLYIEGTPAGEALTLVTGNQYCCIVYRGSTYTYSWAVGADAGHFYFWNSKYDAHVMDITDDGAIHLGTPGAAGTDSSPKYVSCGPGYSTSSGRYGLRFLVCDQADAQTGLGQDLVTPTGYSNAFNLCIAGGRSSGGEGYISFCDHAVNSTSYRYLGGFRDGNGSVLFQVMGTIYATGAITALSDARKKDITGEAGVTVEQIAHAPAVQFLWKDKERRKDGQQVGTLAQYWQTVLPEVVSDKGGELSMQYGVTALVSTIITARKVVDHERRITELEKENERLRTEVEQLRLN